MRINTKEMLSQKVTIVNRLKGVDNDSGKDIFYKKTLNDCVWMGKQIGSRNGNEMIYTEGYQVHIPRNQECTYFEYKDWIAKENLDDCFTLSVDDYVILGEVTEEITPNNVTKIIQKYKPNAFQIRLHDDLNLKGIHANGNFVLNYASMYYVEGV